MIFNFDDSPGGLSPGMINFSDPDALLFESSGAAWEAAVLAPGTLTVQQSVLVDMALVAGGMPGALGVSGKGGVGGEGGGIAIFSGVWLRRGVTYTVTVGGSGEDTILTGSDGSAYTAASGSGSNGGVPSSSRGTPPTRGSDGVQIWGGTSLIQELSGARFGPGGGPGGYCSVDYAYYPGANGGDDGGGAGGVVSNAGNTQATAGAANRGAAGGGAWRDDARGTSGTPGLGGSGIIRIRNHEEATA